MGMYGDRIKAQNEAHRRMMNPNAKPSWMTPSAPKLESLGSHNGQRVGDSVYAVTKGYYKQGLQWER